VSIDEASLAAVSPEQEHERKVAIFDLLEQNSFAPDGAEAGPFVLILSLVENRLCLDISGPSFEKRHLLSLSPFRGIIRDYFMVCESYYDAIRNATPAQIEALDMGRRGLHNDGASLLQARLAGKIEVNGDTARRLFTLVCALHRRGGAL
jgi:uncharacterized protein (UPF0262 family)